ncbi:hypothetical protein ABMY26_27590 [Azospirillum sp. HJ39]|uniref:hypothetical protein n=1 Tax=Azospirillum sp. HJ39 TaxID=3159496 RepID=UPI003555FB93
MPPTPTASDITVPEVLAKLENEFADVARAVADGEFALWVGSGISRQAPRLGDLIERAFDHIRSQAINPATANDYMPALEEFLALAEVPAASVQAQYGQPLSAWPERNTIVDRLWNRYSRVLDIRVAGKPADFVLWEAIDIREAFRNPKPPAAEHLCIAVLALEGVVQDIASANWDGAIEASIERLGNGVPGFLQVVVDPDQLRDPPGRARLLKFHGCIVHATREPGTFRKYLIGSHTQIIGWPEKAEFAAMRHEVVGIAARHKTMVLGLSIQDTNLQTIFSRAREINPWPWPCAPKAPAHIFCEDVIQLGQRDVLRLCYGDAYDNDPVAVHEATLLRAWGEKVLIALALRVLEGKLVQLMQLCLASIGKGAIAAALEPLLKAFRDEVAHHAVPLPGAFDRTAFVNQALTLWSRMLSLFRSGAVPTNPDGYEILSHARVGLIAGDANAQSIARLGIALSLLHYGSKAGYWELGLPASNDLTSGAMTTRASRSGAVDRPLFVVKSATEAIALQSRGAFVNDNAIVVHADDAWHCLTGGSVSARRVSSPPGRTGRIGTTHVSLGALLSRCGDATTLQQDFAAEMIQ